MTKEQILAFQDEYQGSEEEKGDVLKGRLKLKPCRLEAEPMQTEAVQSKAVRGSQCHAHWRVI